ncbi:MAG TPA: hypothetical protein VMR98_02330, partial [Candidatus Polarisedimenticolaceae bacterium]|nr:hypothetical protein [Candidatus Polarisedimenticolaceae bacterium]
MPGKSKNPLHQNVPFSKVLIAALVVTAAIAGLIIVFSSKAASTVNATPATFASAFASAQAGDIIQLAPGSYGMFTGAAKTGTVTIKGPAAPGVATMQLDFNNAKNITIDGVKLTNGRPDNSD